MADIRVRFQLFIDLLLINPHLRRRRTFLRDKNAAHETAVSRRQQGEGQIGKEKPETNNASQQNRHGQPGAIEEFVQRAPVSGDHALDKIASPFLHSGAFMPGLSLAENARAHQRSKGE